MLLSENSYHIINHIIYDIYSSDDNQTMRKNFLQNIELLIPYDKANFFLSASDSENHLINSPISIGFADDAYNDYHETFEKFDYNKWIFTTAQNDSFILSELMSEHELNNNVFARGWLMPKGIEHALLLSLSYDKKFLGVASLFRIKGNDDFTYKDKKILDFLKDHLSLYLYKNSDTLNNTCQFSDGSISKFASKYCLTSRETELLLMLIEGKKISEICSRLSISENTVRKHISHIYQKMNVSSRNELYQLYLTNL